MPLEEQSIETAGERCEVCGAALTDREKEAVLESGGPTLCSVHVAELEPALEEAELEDLPE